MTHLGGQRLQPDLRRPHLGGESTRRVPLGRAGGHPGSEARDDLPAVGAELLHPPGVTLAEGPLLFLLQSPQGLKVSQQG